MNIIENFNQWIETAANKIGIKIFPTDSGALAKQQQDFLISCIEDNLGSKIYNNLKLTRELVDIRKSTKDVDIVQSVIALLGINRYQDIISYMEEGGLTLEDSLYIGRTS